MEKRIVNNYERGLTTTVNDIEHIESQSLTGHRRSSRSSSSPGAKIEAATAQVTAISQTALRQMPPGHDAAAHHPLQRVERPHPPARARERLAQRAAALRLRRRTSSAPTSPPSRARRCPWPYGGKQRQIMIDIDPAAALRVGPLAARRQQRARRAERHRADRARRRSASTSTRSSSTRAPSSSTRSRPSRSRSVNGTTVYMRDVANVRDGYAPQTNIVHVEGKKSVLMSILKHGQREHARRRRAHPRHAADDARAAAQGAEGHAALRSVGLRARGGRGRGEGGGHRRRR